MSGAAPNIPRLLESAERQKVTKYFTVASATLLAVDYFGTVEREVELIWGSEWSAAKVLFFMSRYMPMVDVLVVATLFHLGLGIDTETCRRLFVAETTLFVTGVAIAEAILYLRIYAISGRNRKLMIYLIVQYTLIHIAIYGVYGKFAMHQKFTQSPFPTVIGCLPVPPRIEGIDLNVVLSAMFMLILVDEIVIMIMSLGIGFMKYRSLKSPLIKIFYRDGTFYFIVLAGISLANILFNLIGAPEYRFFIVVIQRVMHSMLSCRMLLHMKAYATGAHGSSGNNSDVLSAEPRFLQRNKRPPPPNSFAQGIHVYEAYRGDPLTSFTDNIEMSTETGKSKFSDLHSQPGMGYGNRV